MRWRRLRSPDIRFHSPIRDIIMILNMRMTIKQFIVYQMEFSYGYVVQSAPHGNRRDNPHRLVARRGKNRLAIKFRAGWVGRVGKSWL